MQSRAETPNDAASPRQGLLALRVHRVIEETSDARSFVLDVPEELERELRYVPGQYLTVDVQWEGFRVHRCYSLSSAPGLDPRPTITVKRVEGGRVSNHLVDRVREGDLLEVHRPAGRFVLDPHRGSRPLVFFAGGSGITPIHSMLKSVLASGGSARLLYANRNAESTIFAAELEELASSNPGRFELRHHRDDASGYLVAEGVRAFVGERLDADFYVCGPKPFMDLVGRVLRESGVPEGHVRIENFVSPTDPDRRAEAGTAASDRPAPAAFLVTLGKKIHSVPYASGRTLLASCKSAGVKAPSSCEDGFCGSCMCKLVEGEVDMDNPLALTDLDIERGRVLACQARPRTSGPLHIDFDSVSFGLAAEGEGGAPPLSLVRLAVVAVLCVAVAWLVRFLHHTV